MNIIGLTNKEIIELRMKCLEPFITVASKAGLEQDTIIRKAEVAWEFATEPLKESTNDNEKKTNV